MAHKRYLRISLCVINRLVLPRQMSFVSDYQL